MKKILNVYECDYKKIKIDALVGLHKKIFPEYFLTSLGDEIIKEYYLWFLKDIQSGLILAENGHEIVGFALYTSKYDELFSTFIKKNKIKIICILLIGLIKFNRPVYRGVIAKTQDMFSKKEKSYDYVCSLVSIGVDPNIHARGIGKKIILKLDDVLVSKKINRYSLSVKKDNESAIKFYEKVNFKQIGFSSKLLYFGKELV